MAGGFVEAVIFDLDGVLIDSEPLHAESWNAVLGKFGEHFEEDWFDAWVGVSDEKLAQHFGDTLPHSISAEDLLERKREGYRRLVDEKLKTFDGVAEGLECLASMPLAVATASRREDVERCLAAVGLQGRFQIIVSIEEVSHPKPDPEAYLLAAGRLNTPPAHCAVIEDSIAGVQSATAAGCQVLAVTTTHAPDALKPARHVVPATADAIAWVLAHR